MERSTKKGLKALVGLIIFIAGITYFSISDTLPGDLMWDYIAALVITCLGTWLMADAFTGD